MKIRTAITLSAVIVAAVAVLANSGQLQPALAQPPLYEGQLQSDEPDGDPPPLLRFFMKRMAVRLELTEPQQEEIHTLIETQIPALKPLIGQLMDSRKRLAEINNGDTFQEAETRSLVEQQSNALNELLVAKERLRHQINQILTPDQRTKADQMRGRFEQRVRRWLDS